MGEKLCFLRRGLFIISVSPNGVLVRLLLTSLKITEKFLNALVVADFIQRKPHHQGSKNATNKPEGFDIRSSYEDDDR